MWDFFLYFCIYWKAMIAFRRVFHANKAGLYNLTLTIVLEKEADDAAISRFDIRFGDNVIVVTKMPGANELFARVRFTAVAAAVATRSKDLSKITQDQMAFIAQKDQAGGKKTLKAWYWMVEGAAYDQEHPRN